MQDKKAIIFVGMPGAGKSVCMEHLKNKGMPSCYFGGITIDEVKARGMEVNEVNERFVREDIRAKEGNGAYALRIIAQVEDHFEQGSDYVVIDGLYSWTEYKIFKESLGDRAIIIGVLAPRKIRHERLAKRPVRPLTESEVIEREYAEIEKLEKGGPIANADYYLTNDRNPEELLTELDKLLANIGVTI